MNYLSKKNFGIPANLLASIAVVLGYSLCSGALSWVTIAFAVIVFLFDFDELVKGAVKNAYKIGFGGYIITMICRIFRTVLSWFSDAQYKGGAAGTTYKVFDTLISVINDVFGIIFILIFAFLLFKAVTGKEVKTPKIEVK